MNPVFCMESVETIELLARSKRRMRILDLLCGDGELCAILETENEAVEDWVAGVYATYKHGPESLQVGQ